MKSSIKPCKITLIASYNKTIFLPSSPDYSAQCSHWADWDTGEFEGKCWRAGHQNEIPLYHSQCQVSAVTLTLTSPELHP